MENEAKEQRDRFVGMLLGTLGASLWGNMSLDKEVREADRERAVSGLLKK